MPEQKDTCLYAVERSDWRNSAQTRIERWLPRAIWPVVSNILWCHVLCRKNRVVRIGALDYDPLPVVKDHTLDAIVEREIQARIKYVLQPGETVDDVERKLKRLRQIVAALTLTRKKVLLGDPVSKLQRNLKPAYDESKATELSKEFWEKYTTEKAQLN